MSFFSQTSGGDTTALPAPQQHRVKDVGFGEAARASAGNTFGALQEEKLISGRRNAAASWVLSQADEGMRQRMLDNPTTDPMVFINELRESGVEIPSGLDFEDFSELSDAAIDDYAIGYLEREEVLSRATTGGKIGALFGGLAGSLDDDENLLTLPLGVPGRAGLAVTMLGEATLNAGIEGAVFNKRQELLSRMGVESDETILQAMGYGALFGAVVPAIPAAIKGGYNAAATTASLGRRALSRNSSKEVADILVEVDDLPEVAMHGHAIRSEVEIREAASSSIERANRSANDELAYDAAEGRARAEPATAGSRGTNIKSGVRPPPRDPLEEDAQFLDDFTAGRVSAGTAEPLLLTNGKIAAPIRTSDDAIQRLEVPAEQAEALTQRFNDGQVIPIRELEDMGVDVSPLDNVRYIIDHYDEMDARFQGQQIPENFDPIDEGPQFRTEPNKLEGEVVQTPLDRRMPAIDETNLLDFGENLTRLAREIEALKTPSADGVDAEATAGALGQVKTIQVTDEANNPVTMSVEDVVKEIEEDLAIAEAAKVCMI